MLLSVNKPVKLSVIVSKSVVYVPNGTDCTFWDKHKKNSTKQAISFAIDMSRLRKIPALIQFGSDCRLIPIIH